MRAASSVRGSSWPHSVPTVRTTTARLKYTWAMTMAAAVWSHDAGRRARNAVPTTTVGSTNGTVTTARTSALPGNR